MRWTDKRPTEPGWYWMRPKGSVAVPPEIVQVLKHADDDEWMLRAVGVQGYWSRGASMEWSGPIPEPSEPKQEEGGGGG